MAFMPELTVKTSEIRPSTASTKNNCLLILSINRCGHFLLTESVLETASQNQLTEVVTFNVTASVNTPIFRGGHIIDVRLS